MIKTVIKRNGTTEEFSPSKINGWGEWAAKTLGKHVDWSSVVLHTVSTSPEVVSTTELQNRLIDTCLDKKTWAYNQMAGRLYAPVFTKEIHGSINYPSVKELQQKLVQEGYMNDSGYTDSEYAKIEKIIDHKRNLQMAHFQQDYILKKYALKDRVSGRIFETPQFVFMRMAMELSNFAEGDQKLIHVQK